MQKVCRIIMQINIRRYKRVKGVFPQILQLNLTCRIEFSSYAKKTKNYKKATIWRAQPERAEQSQYLKVYSTNINLIPGVKSLTWRRRAESAASGEQGRCVDWQVWVCLFWASCRDISNTGKSEGTYSSGHTHN